LRASLVVCGGITGRDIASIERSTLADLSVVVGVSAFSKACLESVRIPAIKEIAVET